MGWFDWFWSTLRVLGLYNVKAKIIFLGLDNAGKTTLLHVLTDGHLTVHQPTMHAQMQEVSAGSVMFTAYDLGGHTVARRLWKDYYESIDAVMFVVDAHDVERLPEAKTELDALLSDESIARVPVVVLGNKVDLPGTLSEDEFRAALGLQNTTGVHHDEAVRPIEVFMASIAQRSGYKEAFQWLGTHLR